MRLYKIGHTIPKVIEGGVQEGFAISSYHGPASNCDPKSAARNVTPAQKRSPSAFALPLDGGL